jgi:hypothetical protein
VTAAIAAWEDVGSFKYPGFVLLCPFREGRLDDQSLVFYLSCFAFVRQAA